ncbi:flavodoxin family protein (plasmid) [Arsenophonus nasoniae]|uniref:Flavoprotein WrbA n=1 Tax=Arsenophonus nasoniae TaxID=638 RepID=A0A4P7KZN0_9GAMM|nr:flavodoxin family protein [Arsenophonus nasoniae]QBY45681.1 p-benzoquinone reductase [Arsenophonus nasoniae]WGM03282.1 flavodoxin family protein [Arsenophonus nasoniae]WGM07937.1 flavodoxin family protein [Arsenophonus nasoniae]WGM12917.1 flavodoxin family protein [Arsenophonus nasoniae]WGM17621.1 flavodoxin family protein [Arsenophonus nasoniae]
MVNIAVVYHSGYGHTKAIAEAVIDGVKEVTDVDVKLISVEDIDQHWDFLNNQANAIIFGSPTYMGGVSAQFKGFMDASSKHWGSWRDKLAAGFTCSASRSGDKLSTLQHLSVFAAQHQMLWVSLGLMPGNNNSQGSENDVNRLGSFLGMMAQANADQGIEGIRSSDKETAKILGKRVAQATLRWNK